MKVIPDLSVEFSDAKAEAVTRKIEELDDGIIWLIADMGKIASGEIGPTRAKDFARKSLAGLTAIITNELK